MASTTKQLFIVALVFILLIGGVYYATQEHNNGRAQVSEKPQVMATVFPVYDIARNVAGNAVDVTLLLPSGASPHTFDPSPNTLRELEESKALYAVGHGLDNWAIAFTEGTETPIVILDRGIETRQAIAHAHDEDESHEEGEEDHEDDERVTDPHYWLSIPNGKRMTQTITDDLSARFPAHAETFQNNATAYMQVLDETEQEIQHLMQTEVESNQLITLHDAWYYFAEQYGLNIVGTYEPSAAREPTPQYLINLTNAIRVAETKTIYSEPQIPTASLDSFVSDNDLTIAELDPVGGVAGRTSYIDLMLYNARTIAQNQ